MTVKWDVNDPFTCLCTVMWQSTVMCRLLSHVNLLSCISLLSHVSVLSHVVCCHVSILFYLLLRWILKEFIITIFPADSEASVTGSATLWHEQEVCGDWSGWNACTQFFQGGDMFFYYSLHFICWYRKAFLLYFWHFLFSAHFFLPNNLSNMTFVIFIIMQWVIVLILPQTMYSFLFQTYSWLLLI